MKVAAWKLLAVGISQFDDPQFDEELGLVSDVPADMQPLFARISEQDWLLIEQEFELWQEEGKRIADFRSELIDQAKAKG